MRWITRERIKVDRIASPWLISRFIDREAEFVFHRAVTDLAKITAGYMQRDLVERRRWISKQHYAEGLALARPAPVPLAAQLAIYPGWASFRNVAAPLVAVVFVLQSFVMVLGLSVLHLRLSGLPWMQAALYRIGAAAVAIIARSVVKLVRMTMRARSTPLGPVSSERRGDRVDGVRDRVGLRHERRGGSVRRGAAEAIAPVGGPPRGARRFPLGLAGGIWSVADGFALNVAARFARAGTTYAIEIRAGFIWDLILSRKGA